MTVASIAYLRAILRIPIRTIQSYLKSLHQIQVSVGEISELCQRTVKVLGQSAEALQAEARGSPVVHMDETGWRENGQNGYTWCVVTNTPQPIRYFEYHQSQSGDIPLELLGHFSGHLVSDFYAGYNKHTGSHQRCWVHLLRDLHELRESESSTGEVGAWALGLQGMYNYAVRQLHHGTSAENRQMLYNRLWRMTEQFGLLYATSYKHPCCALAKRLLRHQDELFQFVLQPNLPADNNLAERALCLWVVQQKISGGSRSSSGSQTRMQLASLFETWKARQLNPLWECWQQLGYSYQPSLP